MLKEFVEKILDLKQEPLVQVENRHYSLKSLTAVSDPKADELEVSSLTSLTEYLKANKDELHRERIMVHIESPDRVSVISNLSHKWQDRNCFLAAVREQHGNGFEFGRFMDNESFNIALQSKFHGCSTREKILKIIGTMTTGKLTTSSDDGIGQTVATKAGVTLQAEALIPNPVQLSPYRTFLEVKQPESPFVFRVKQGREGEMPTCALFEADGGRWRLEAIAKIREFLEKELNGVGVTILS